MNSIDAVAACSTDRFQPYDLAFENCVRFSAARVSNVSSMALQRRMVGNDEISAAMQRVIYGYGLTEDDIRGAAGQCLKWAHFLAPAISFELKQPAWPTLGQLWKGDAKIWGPTWEELTDMLDRGLQPGHLLPSDGGFNAHAWITLQSGQIIDLTFATTLAVTHGGAYAHLFGQIAAGEAAVLYPNHRYVPMLAGRESFELLSERSFAPLLAQSRDDLAVPNAGWAVFKRLGE